MRRWAGVFLGLMLSGVVGVTKAHAVCEAALVTSTYNRVGFSQTDYRLAEHVTQEQYDKAKQSGGASAYIFGIPAGADYSTFKSSAKRASSYYSERLTNDEFVNIAWTGLDPNSVQTYQACLNAEVFSQNGLRAAVDQATESHVSLRVRWHIPGNSAPLAVRWSGAAGSNLPTTIQNGETVVIINRPKSGAMLLAANGAGYSIGPFRITAFPKPVKLPCPDISGSWRSAGNGVTSIISQSACDVSSSFSAGDIDHTMVGSYDLAKRVFSYTVSRRENGCTVTFKGYFSNISRVGMESYVTGTDGACGFSEDWTEHLTWVRI